MVVGILALQGCVEPHERHLAKLGASFIRVRKANDLSQVSGLILPGGESTTMLKLLEIFSLIEPLKERARTIPLWGICAGSILMAREISEDSRAPGQYSLGLMDFSVSRNAYGRQLESFSDGILLEDGRQEVSTFIRAPKFLTWGPFVKAVGRCRGETVFLEEGKNMVTAFHPELSDNLFFHDHFLQKIKHAQ